MTSNSRLGTRIKSSLGFSRRHGIGYRVSSLTRTIKGTNPDASKDWWLGKGGITRLKFFDGMRWQSMPYNDGSSTYIGDIVGGNYAKFEGDGTLTFAGNATVWKDVYFPQGNPKTSGAGNPSLNTILSPLRGYSYAINDAMDFDPQEYPHDGKVGGQVEWHVHWVSMTNVAATRGIKWQLEWTYANPSGVMASVTTVSIDLTIPANTPVNTSYYSHILPMVTVPGVGPATIFWVRLTRIASAGTAPANDPFVSAVHFHYEVDTIGSRISDTK